MQRTLEKISFFSHLLIRLSLENAQQPVCVSQAGAGYWSCRTPGRVHSSTLTLHLWEDFQGSVPIVISLPSSPGHGSCFQGCYYAHSEIFSFQSLRFNYTSSLSKGWVLWDNEIFPQVMLLSLPLDSSINRKLPVSRRKLSWFLYSLNLFSPKPLANLLFIFQGYKNEAKCHQAEISTFTEPRARPGEPS